MRRQGRLASLAAAPAAGGLCVACLVALATLGGRAIRLAVAAFVLVVLAGYALFLAWIGGLFAVWPTLFGD